MKIRRGLHRAGFRYRLHDKRLPGKPDMVFPGRRAVVMVHGCFWHRHECHLFKWPSSRPDFWREKINRNREKDAESLKALEADGWRVLTIWECTLKGRTRLPEEEVIKRCADWLCSGTGNCVIEGKRNVANRSADMD